MPIVTATLALGGLALVLTTLLVLAQKRLAVVEDPRIDVVEDMLPHANCGACGLPGCRPFAEALVGGPQRPGSARSVARTPAKRSSYLGVDVGAEEKRVARLACAGGTNVARNHARYDGLESCRAAAHVAGGGKGCFWGCLGIGDCEVVCDFDAIHMDANRLPVVDEDKCTACGDCVEVCPKDLFSLQPISRRLWVQCKSLDEGDDVLEECEVGCTACGKCAMDGPGLIRMVNNLPVIDYSRPHKTQVPIQRCPTGAIVWLDPKAGPVKGPEAKKIIRKGVRVDAPT